MKLEFEMSVKQPTKLPEGVVITKIPEGYSGKTDKIKKKKIKDKEVRIPLYDGPVGRKYQEDWEDSPSIPNDQNS